MRIGLTYDLRSQYLAEGYTAEQTAEMDREETIDALAGALEELGHVVVRIGHARDLIDKLAAGDSWDLVFNLCEGLSGYSRESQVPAILDVYGLAYTFSDPLTLSLCLHKGFTKSVLREKGVPTSDFAVISSVADLSGLALDFPAFVKPISEGTGKGVSPSSKVYNSQELRRVCEELLHRFSQPALIEPFLAGREFTVSVIGEGAASRVLGTLEIILRSGAEPDIYSYANKERCEELVEYCHVTDEDAVVATAQATALFAWQALNCRDAGRVDLRCDSMGVPLVMELNPLAGMHPTHSDLPMTATAVGVSYRELVRMIVEAASQRVAGRSHSPATRPGRPHFDLEHGNLAHGVSVLTSFE